MENEEKNLWAMLEHQKHVILILNQTVETKNKEIAGLKVLVEALEKILDRHEF